MIGSRFSVRSESSKGLLVVRVLSAQLGELILLELPDRQVFQNAVLDLFEVVVVLVQNLAGFPDVDLALGALVPGQRGQPVEIGLDDAVLGGGRWQLAQSRSSSRRASRPASSGIPASSTFWRSSVISASVSLSSPSSRRIAFICSRR